MKTIYNCNGKFEYKEEEDEEYYWVKCWKLDR
jgi:hypothetical protein